MFPDLISDAFAMIVLDYIDYEDTGILLNFQRKTLEAMEFKAQ